MAQPMALLSSLNTPLARRLSTLPVSSRQRSISRMENAPRFLFRLTSFSFALSYVFTLVHSSHFIMIARDIILLSSARLRIFILEIFSWIPSSLELSSRSPTRTAPLHCRAARTRIPRSSMKVKKSSTTVHAGLGRSHSTADSGAVTETGLKMYQRLLAQEKIFQVMTFRKRGTRGTAHSR